MTRYAFFFQLCWGCALLAGGCGAQGETLAPTHRPGQPSIAEIRVNRADKRASYLLGADFVLLQVAVNNPETTYVSGDITCLPQDNGGAQSVRHRFSVAPESRGLFNVPVPQARREPIRLRCRLQDVEDDLGARRSPSPWVTATVPGRPRA